MSGNGKMSVEDGERALALVRASSIRSESMRWLWRGRVPLPRPRPWLLVKKAWPSPR